MVHNFLLKLKNEIKSYDWGSQNAFTTLFNIPNSHGQPLAEIWMGVHPSGPSIATDTKNNNYRLDELISTYPVETLGQTIKKKFGCLPFLFKVIAAKRSLSIQVHPAKMKAISGFSNENDQHIPFDAKHRNYKDRNHKPELVYALTNFQAMNGFQCIDNIIKNFNLFNIDSLRKELASLRSERSATQLKYFFENLLTLEDKKKQAALNELKTAIHYHHCDLANVIKQLEKDYPHDIGLFMPMLLNVVVVKPGEAMFLDAETPHAYLKGVALEIMANSDNVLRAALTSKHIDVSELLENTQFKTKPINTLRTVAVQHENQSFFPVPVDDFKFSIINSDLTSRAQTVVGPEILFCLSGSITIEAGNDKWLLIPGESVFVMSASKHYHYIGNGRLARAFV